MIVLRLLQTRAGDECCGDVYECINVIIDIEDEKIYL
jgi:hypothetical protein